jgi:hypothetical protein
MNARVSIWFAKLGANEEEIDEKKTPKKKKKKTAKHTYIKTCSPAPRRLLYYCVQRDFASSAQ